MEGLMTWVKRKTAMISFLPNIINIITQRIVGPDLKRMEIGVDFLRCLDTDVAVNIFKYLDDPRDLVRASLVSRYWHNFVVSNELSKQLCVAMFPQLSNIAHVGEIDTRKNNQSGVGVGSSKSVEGDILYTEHKVYASLLQLLRKLPSVHDCVRIPYSASSTNDRQCESLLHTQDRVLRTFYDVAPHWSSKGQKDPNVHETLIYELHSDLCVISDICIQPFQAFSQPGNPIYSSKSVRFRMGHRKYQKDMQLLPLPCLWELAEDKFIWTYTSEEFPMSQENRLQHFEFKEPVLCIGGYLEIQLLGRVQRKETDGLFYICVSLVKVMGREPVTHQFRAGLTEPNGILTLWKSTYVKITRQ